MSNEIICLAIGLWIGAGAGAVFTAICLDKVLARKNREIGSLRAQLTLKAILIPIVQNLLKSVLDPFLTMYEKDFEEKPKDGIKSKRKNNIR